LLRFIIPVALVAGLLFFLYRLATGGKKTTVASTYTPTAVATVVPVVDPAASDSIYVPNASDAPISSNLSDADTTVPAEVSLDEASSEIYPDENKN
jgi:hypothetical protein